MKEKRKYYYKVLMKDMKSPHQEFQYELNKKYSIQGSIELCEQGFHACEHMYELIFWCKNTNIKNCRFFKCILGDNVIKQNNTYKVVSDSITLIDEIPFEEVDRSIKDNIHILTHCKYFLYKLKIFDQGYGADILLHDKSELVRSYVKYNSIH